MPDHNEHINEIAAQIYAASTPETIAAYEASVVASQASLERSVAELSEKIAQETAKYREEGGTPEELRASLLATLEQHSRG